LFFRPTTPAIFSRKIFFNSETLNHKYQFAAKFSDFSRFELPQLLGVKDLYTKKFGIRFIRKPNIITTRYCNKPVFKVGLEKTPSNKIILKRTIRFGNIKPKPAFPAFRINKVKNLYHYYDHKLLIANYMHIADSIPTIIYNKAIFYTLPKYFAKINLFTTPYTTPFNFKITRQLN
jgi:hypothetical protein